MIDLEAARQRCWEIFRQEYPDYVSEDVLYERLIRAHVTPQARVLDAGCGHDLPFARALAPYVAEVVGVDRGLDQGLDQGPDRLDAQASAGSRVKLPHNVVAIEGDLEALPFSDAHFDLAFSRSVLEHLERPEQVIRELARVLKPGGLFIFLIPNFWDYVSLLSWMIPNGLHAWVVERIQGRSPKDTFPTFYRANTIGDLERLFRGAGLVPGELNLLSQYPAYLMFSSRAFRVGIAWDRLLRQHERLAFLRSWILGMARKPG